jgi:hypothetical protein
MSNWLWEKLVPRLHSPSISISPRLMENIPEKRLDSKFSDLLSYRQERIGASGFERNSEVVLTFPAWNPSPEVVHGLADQAIID